MTVPTEYLTTAEVAQRLRWSSYTLREKIRQGLFVEGVHFIKPRRSRMRWKWGEVVCALEVAPAPASILARGRKVA